jgi:hypothetical protein
VDWIFAGSQLVGNPLDTEHPKTYLANDGDVICVSNFDTGMLDLPVESSQKNAELDSEAWTERIPPVETKVTIILEPVGAPRKGKNPLRAAAKPHGIRAHGLAGERARSAGVLCR